MPAIQQTVLPLEVIYGKVVADSQFSPPLFARS